MVSIPRSGGVTVGKNTQVSEVAPTMAQTQIIPDAIRGVGNVAAGIGFDMQQEQEKERQIFNTTQALDYRNKLKSFDNQQRIALSEMPANSETILNQKQKILDEREEYIATLKDEYGEDKDLIKLIDRETSSSRVGLEFSIDKDLSAKKKAYGTMKIYESIGAIKERFETASSPEDYLNIKKDLDETLLIGYNSGLVSPKDIEKQNEAFKLLRKERELELKRQQAFSSAINGSMVLDASNKDDKDLVDANFQKMVEQDPQNAIELAEELSIKTGIIPSEAKSHWSAMLFNGSVDQKVNAAQTINDLIDSNTSLQNQFSSQEVALSQEIMNRQTIGLPASKIVEFAEADIKKNKSEKRELRDAQFNLEFGTDGSKKAIEQIQEINKEFQDKSGIFFEATLPEEMGMQYRRLARDFYLNEGVSMDTALDMAKKKVKAEWGITQVGEKRYQKYAPETIYGIEGGNNKWIANQAIQMVRKNTIDPLPNIKNDIVLSPIPSTIPSGKPSYFIYTKNEFGAIDITLDNRNQPLVFKPDLTKTEEYKKDQERRESLRLTPQTEKEFKKRLIQIEREKKLERASNSLSGIR